MWADIDETIISVEGFCLSSKFTKGKIYGQNLEVKTIGFIQINSESGKSGFGESYAAIYAPEIFSNVVEFFKNYLVGKKIGSKEIMNEIFNIPFIGRSGILRSISGSIEIALWDLRGKILNIPTYKLLGGKNKKIPCYASGGSVIMNNEEIKKDVEDSIKEGFKAYKMRIGFQNWKKDIERVKIARSIFGKRDLMVDAIMGTIRPSWDLEQALKKIEDLSKFDLRWIEEPLHPSNIKELSILKSKSPIPIAAGEAYSGLLEYQMLLDNNSVDILQFDSTHSGGFEICKKLSEISLKNNIQCAVHVWGSPIAVLANLHLASYIKNLVYIEIPRIELEISDYLWMQKPKISDGYIEISDTPGLGINIEEKVKNKFPLIKGSGFRIKKNN